MDKETLTEEIKRLKSEKNAVILAHNYQSAEIQDIADFAGDSLQLARKCNEIETDLIVFCGVYFMAETAAILNPKKTVLIPDTNAGCPLADFASAEQVKEWKKKYPEHRFVAYVNSNADVKAEVDICCTSSNAVKVVESLQTDKIVMLPDQNLASFVAEKTGIDIIPWKGFCVVHETTDENSVREAIKLHPNAVSMAHPECPKKIRDLVDEVCSTGQMFGVVERHSEADEFIVITEWGMNHALEVAFPEKKFYEPKRRMECKQMKKITLQKLRDALLDGGKSEDYIVRVEAAIADKAKDSIIKMLKI